MVIIGPKVTRPFTEKQAIEAVRHEVALDLISKYGQKLNFSIDKVDELRDIEHEVAPSLLEKEKFLKRKHGDFNYLNKDAKKLEYLGLAEYDEVAGDIYSYFVSSIQTEIKRKRQIDTNYPRDILFYTIYTRTNSLREIYSTTAIIRQFTSFHDEYGISDDEWNEMQNFIFNDFRTRIINLLEKNNIASKNVYAKEASIFNKIMKKNVR